MRQFGNIFSVLYYCHLTGGALLVPDDKTKKAYETLAEKFKLSVRVIVPAEDIGANRKIEAPLYIYDELAYCDGYYELLSEMRQKEAKDAKKI